MISSVVEAIPPNPAVALKELIEIARAKEDPRMLKLVNDVSVALAFVVQHNMDMGAEIELLRARLPETRH